MKKIITLIILTCILCHTSTCYSQEPFWEKLPSNPQNFLYNMIPLSKDVFFACTEDGLFITNDSGVSWEPIFEGKPFYSLFQHSNGTWFGGGRGRIYTLAPGDTQWVVSLHATWNVYIITENNQGDIFVGGKDVYRSVNNGQDWDIVFPQPENDLTFGIVTKDNIVFVGTKKQYWDYSKGGVYRSYNNGETFEPQELNVFVRDMKMDSQGNIYVCGGTGVYRLDNESDEWVKLAVPSGYHEFSSLAITPDDVIYAGLHNYFGNGGVMRSFDKGENWEVINDGLESSGDRYICGVSFSEDGYMFAFGNYGSNHIHRSRQRVFIPTSIQEPPRVNSRIYPNPSRGIFYIDNPGFPAEAFQVFNLSGRMVAKGVNENKIDISYLPDGVYMIRVFSGGKVESHKIVKL